VEPPEFVQRLAPDPLVARRAAFALFVLTFLEQIGLQSDAVNEGAKLAAAQRQNPHLFAGIETHQLSAVDQRAALDLTRWARAQRLDREEPQVAYELGLLALGVELPPVLVGSLRQLDLTPTTRVVELPNGAGYPVVFLQSLHPHWRAAEYATHLVTSSDARQLAAWSHLLLTRRLTPRHGAIVHVTAGETSRAHEAEIALLYNSPPEIEPGVLVTAPRFVVV
jgi:hypothetical protein